MDIRIADGGGEQLKKNIEKADAFTVINLANQKPFMTTSPPPSASSNSSTSTSVVAVQSPESVIDLLKTTFGQASFSHVEEEEDEWVAVEREADVITDKAPEIDEVEDAFSALQLMFDDDDADNDDKSEEQVSESEFVDWIEPPLQLCNTRLLQPYMLDRFYDAFHQFQTDPSVQRMVMSLSSDKAVWDAVMNNEVVRELITNAERSEEDSSSAVDFIRRLFERSAIRIMDAMERVTKYVNDLFNVVPEDETVVLATGAKPVMEKLQMTVLLTVLVLLIVLATRVTRAR